MVDLTMGEMRRLAEALREDANDMLAEADGEDMGGWPEFTKPYARIAEASVLTRRADELDALSRKR